MNSNLCTIVLLVLATNLQLTAQSWDQLGATISSEDAAVVDISSNGETIITGAPVDGNNIGNDGMVRVFDQNGNSWVQRGTTFNGENSGDNLGFAVSISDDGNTIAMGSPRNDDGGADAGMTKVYSWDGTAWIQMGASINGVGFNDQGGNSVSLSADGTILAIGASNNSDNGIQSGHVRVFTWDGSDWVQLGSSIPGANGGDRCGYSISISADGNTIAMGEITNDDGGNNAGQVRIFSFDGSDWNQKGGDIEGDEESGRLGWSVALSGDGNTVAAGAPRNFDDNTGFVKVYQWNGSNWETKGNTFVGANEDALLGNSISLSNDGGQLAIGSPGFEVNSLNKGIAQSFYWSNNTWMQRGDDFIGAPNGAGLGQSVALNPSGNVLAVLSIGTQEVDVFQWDIETAVQDLAQLTGISIFPNPTYSNIKITTNQEELIEEILITNSQGAVVGFYGNVKSSELLLNLNGNAGLYFIKVTKSSGAVAVTKVLKL